MNLKNRLLTLMAVMSLTGLISAPARSASMAAVPTVKPSFEVPPSAMFSLRSPELIQMSGFPASLISPAALQSVRLAAIEKLSPNPVIVLHRGPEIAVIPSAFAAGSSAVLVDGDGKASSFILTGQTVAKLEEHLKNGNVDLAHRALFDGSKAEGSVVAVPDAAKPSENEQLAVTVATLLKGIQKLTVSETGGYAGGYAASKDLYAKDEVDNHINAISEAIRQLVIAGKLEDAAALVKGIRPDTYWPKGWNIPRNESFYGRSEVNGLLEVIGKLLQRR